MTLVRVIPWLKTRSADLLFLLPDKAYFPARTLSSGLGFKIALSDLKTMSFVLAVPKE
ncbi:hypothetical protein [Sagittula sp. SSi028]|uniref:hypothetical protein n=1 Tax=Sagittula sp. SSi028 TaxID=3400636 RepID=UPI003AF4D62A